MPMHCYLITNAVNGHKYVGITKLKEGIRLKQHIKDAVKGSNGMLHRAIRKHGPENFTSEVIAYSISRKDLAHLEKEFILELRPEYNMTMGGEGIVGLSKESIARANAARQAIRDSMTEEQRAAFAAAVSKAQKKIAKVHRKNTKNWWKNATPEQRAKRLAGFTANRGMMKGHKHTEQSRAKMSATHNKRLLRLALAAVRRAEHAPE